MEPSYQLTAKCQTQFPLKGFRCCGCNAFWLNDEETTNYVACHVVSDNAADSSMCTDCLKNGTCTNTRHGKKKNGIKNPPHVSVDFFLAEGIRVKPSPTACLRFVLVRPPVLWARQKSAWRGETVFCFRSRYWRLRFARLEHWQSDKGKSVKGNGTRRRFVIQGNEINENSDTSVTLLQPCKLLF